MESVKRGRGTITSTPKKGTKPNRVWGKGLKTNRKGDHKLVKGKRCREGTKRK